jgi:hypothetical protein
MKEALVSSKLEAISLEYNHLLATQLDSQRQYFEALLAQQDAKQQAAVAAAKAAAESAQAASQSAAGSAKESERKRQQLERKLVSSADSNAALLMPAAGTQQGSVFARRPACCRNTGQHSCCCMPVTEHTLVTPSPPSHSCLASPLL